MNEVLKTREQVNGATKWLQKNRFTTHGLSCKDFELAQATSELKPGNILDMGADGSFILHNAVKIGHPGMKVGIDLAEVTGTNRAEGAEYFVGDLMQTPFPDESFDQVFSLSVIEHEVNYSRFAQEVSRILKKGGELIVSFDYWPEKIDTSLTKLYSLSWNILDRINVMQLISELKEVGLTVDGEIDWAHQDAVINPQYCSPAQCSYTFFILKFIKA